MAEYIEREAVLAKQYNASNFVNPMLAEMVVDVRDIEDIPAADVVEVVRCGECAIKFTKECALYGGMLNGTDYFLYHGEDFYCKYGKRRGE